jgi:hypothetical protein
MEQNPAHPEQPFSVRRPCKRCGNLAGKVSRYHNPASQPLRIGLRAVAAPSGLPLNILYSSSGHKCVTFRLNINPTQVKPSYFAKEKFKSDHFGYYKENWNKNGVTYPL